MGGGGGEWGWEEGREDSPLLKEVSVGERDAFSFFLMLCSGGREERETELEMNGNKRFFPSKRV